MDKALSENVPGVKFGFSQPIEMRVNELVAGVKSDVAALIYGPDLDVLRQKAAEVETVLVQDPRRPGHQVARPPGGCRCSGSRSAATSSPATGSRPADVLDAVAALGGTTVGTVFEGQKRVRRSRSACRESWRNDPERIGQIRVADPKGRPIPLRDLADDRLRGGPQRDRARERPAPGRGRGQRPGPRHRRLRRRGPGRDRPRGQAPRPAT